MARTFTNHELLTVTHAVFSLWPPHTQQAFNDQLGALWGTVASHLQAQNDIFDVLTADLGR